MDTLKEFQGRVLEVFNKIERSTVILSLLTTISLLVIYLQHLRILKSPFTSLSNTSDTTTESQCSNCHTSKPLSQLKACSQCKRFAPSGSPIAYFCNQTCQRENWKTHKLVCGSWKNLETVQERMPDGLSRPELERMLQKWCDFNRHLLIFATIHALNLPRIPTNSLEALLMVTLTHRPTKSDGPIHEAFAVDHIGSMDARSFANANPGMLNAFQEMDRVRARVHERGGVGAGMLLVRCGPVVQVIPVGLPPQTDLDTIKPEKDWRAQFDAAIKAGIQWKPPARPNH